MKTGIIYTPLYQNHENYPECPDRVRVSAEYLIKKGIDTFTEPLDFSESWIKKVHTHEYLSEIISAGSIEFTDIKYDNALRSVYGCLTAGKMLLNDEIQNAFVLNRPPGHHTYANKGGGFCFLNNAGILTKYLQENGMEKVMIIDWDAHHGNGTESIFYEDNTVLFTSIHQSPLYPGTGRIKDIGKGEGEGYTINVPVPPGTGHDSYMKIFSEIVAPVGKKFNPDIVIISAGQDGHKYDSVSHLSLCAGSYHAMTTQIMKNICSSIIGVLEGGYNLSYLPDSIYSIVTALRGEEFNGDFERVEEPEGIQEIIQKIKKSNPNWW